MAAQTVLERLRAGQVVVCDGAMGTMLHAAGVPLDGSLPELNLSRPALVRDLHAAYVSAGAQILQTNTFGANRLRLAGAGLEGSVSEINIAGARLAREATAQAQQAQHAEHPVLVAGSVGPAASAPAVRRVPASARAQILREQITALCDWVDLLILETFGDLESLVQAVEVATSCSDLPIVAQLTFGDDGRTLRGGGSRGGRGGAVRPAGGRAGRQLHGRPRGPGGRGSVSWPTAPTCRCPCSPMRGCRTGSAGRSATPPTRRTSPRPRPDSWPPGPPCWAAAAGRHPLTFGRSLRRSPRCPPSSAHR